MFMIFINKQREAKIDKELCITTYVTGDYQNFIPLYIFSILKSYPNYFPLIFCGEKIKPNIRKSLKILKKIGSFKIIENYLKEIPHVYPQTKRWFIYSKELENFRYIYIGDVDIFIVSENIPLLEQHIIHCKKLNLCYSNIIRDNGGIFFKMTGLHFVETKRYFKKMKPVIKKYKKKKSEELFNGVIAGNEMVLLNMIKESGLDTPPLIRYPKDFISIVNFTDPNNLLFRPDHGVHFALFRDKKIFGNHVLNQEIYRVDKNALNQEIYKYYLKEFFRMIDDPVFRKIEENFESDLVKNIFAKIKKYRKV